MRDTPRPACHLPLSGCFAETAGRLLQESHGEPRAQMNQMIPYSLGQDPHGPGSSGAPFLVHIVKGPPLEVTALRT